GNAASQAQFYVTDSVNHFITGSIYFRSKPNYDSIVPAANYLKNDIKHLMESLTWKEDSLSSQLKEGILK
ncbi:MAG: gliding motility lipoprotein GldD, partial [Mesonia sp.]